VVGTDASTADLIRPRHAEHVLADIGEDQVGRDRCGLVDAHLAPFAFDVVFLGEGEAVEHLEHRTGGALGGLNA
jgi:hypothetical protein